MQVLVWLVIKRQLAGLGHSTGLKSWGRGLKYGGGGARITSEQDFRATSWQMSVVLCQLDGEAFWNWVAFVTNELESQLALTTEKKAYHSSLLKCSDSLLAN